MKKRQPNASEWQAARAATRHPQLDATFAALASPTRRDMLRLLSRHDLHVTELAAYFAMSLPGASKHIKQLEKAGLVSRHVIGRDHLIQIAPQPLEGAAEWLEQFSIFWPARDPR